MQECTNDRTKDFTLALMDFIEWDENSNSNLNSNSISNSNSNLNSNQSVNSSSLKEELNNDREYYVWPVFILDMLNHPVEWSAWRRKVERGINFEVKKSRGNFVEKSSTTSKLENENNIEKDFSHEVSTSSAAVTELGPGPGPGPKSGTGTELGPVVMTRRLAYCQALKEDRLKEIENFYIEGKGQVME